MPLTNEFNNLTAKQWLPFQKSWFLDQGTRTLYTDTFRFFTKAKIKP